MDCLGLIYSNPKPPPVSQSSKARDRRIGPHEVLHVLKAMARCPYHSVVSKDIFAVRCSRFTIGSFHSAMRQQWGQNARWNADAGSEYVSFFCRARLETTPKELASPHI